MSAALFEHEPLHHGRAMAAVDSEMQQEPQKSKKPNRKVGLFA